MTPQQIKDLRLQAEEMKLRYDLQQEIGMRRWYEREVYRLRNLFDNILNYPAESYEDHTKYAVDTAKHVIDNGIRQPKEATNHD